MVTHLDSHPLLIYSPAEHTLQLQTKDNDRDLWHLSSFAQTRERC